ncbi:hypothetical protein AVEN_93465-1 [Araneus ventricosus]|uniref:Uncharacterized protein n=1 Tax=Araneus ventricosus TaxID=182803 RepID=A0A4Y2AP53_ARAVE|nr:hypothetical protein AVEN_93465-1 [Araneus ventricosus]
MEIYRLCETYGQPTAARRGNTRIRHLDGSKGDPAGQTTALFINSNFRYGFRCNGSGADIRRSKPDVGIRKNLSLDLRPLSASRILTADTAKGSVRQKLLQKQNFPSPRLSIKALGKFLKAGRHASPFLHSFLNLRGRRCRRESPYSFLLLPPFFNAKNALSSTQAPSS